jgi:hypothetical protein
MELGPANTGNFRHHHTLGLTAQGNGAAGLESLERQPVWDIRRENASDQGIKVGAARNRSHGGCVKADHMAVWLNRPAEMDRLLGTNVITQGDDG